MAAAVPITMAACPAASDETVTGADGNLSAGATGPMLQGDIENALPVMILSWRAYLRQHQERFGKLDKAVRARLVRVWVIQACFVLLALAVPPALLVHFSGHEMAQAWVMATALCFYVFIFLFLLVRRRRWCYADFLRLTYGLLLAYLAAGVIGPCTAVFVMHLSTVWAAGYLGYCLAVNRLRHGSETERAIDTLPPPSHWITIGSVVSVLWTALMAAFVYSLNVTDADALDIVLVLSFFGWFHATIWVFAVGLGCMDAVLLKGELVQQLLAWMVGYGLMCSIWTGLLFPVFTVLLQWLLLMAVVAFLAYILTVYRHYLQTAAAAPSTPAMANKEMQSEIQQDSLGHVKLDIPALEEAPSETTEAAAI